MNTLNETFRIPHDAQRSSGQFREKCSEAHLKSVGQFGIVTLKTFTAAKALVTGLTGCCVLVRSEDRAEL